MSLTRVLCKGLPSTSPSREDDGGHIGQYHLSICKSLPGAIERQWLARSEGLYQFSFCFWVSWLEAHGLGHWAHALFQRTFHQKELVH